MTSDESHYCVFEGTKTQRARQGLSAYQPPPELEEEACETDHLNVPFLPSLLDLIISLRMLRRSAWKRKQGFHQGTSPSENGTNDKARITVQMLLMT